MAFSKEASWEYELELDVGGSRSYMVLDMELDMVPEMVPEMVLEAVLEVEIIGW